MNDDTQLIILEGPDGGGKSTIASRIAETYGYATVHHHGPYPDDRQPWYRYLDSLLYAVEDPQVLVVMDRSWLSEFPYGRSFRGSVRFDERAARALERIALTLRGVVVNCAPASFNTVLDSYKTRKDTEYVDDTRSLERIWEWYRDELKRSTCLPILHHARDNGDVDTDNAIELAFGASDGYYGDREPDFDPISDGMIGNVDTGDILILGDRPNGDYDLPFAGLKGCSAWLSNQLAKTGIPESRLRFLNVRTQTGAFKSAELGEEADDVSHVIALGSVARAWADDAGIELTACVPHPQYWKRFHYGEAYPLVNVLTKEL